MDEVESERKLELERYFRTVFWALPLVGGLFIFHTATLYYTAWGTEKAQGWVVGCVGMHAGGIGVVLACFFAVFIAHCVEGLVWAYYLRRHGLLESYLECLYFALTSLCALGYGDVVLPRGSRILGPLMATSGLIMFGCSTAFMFLVIQRAWESLPKSLLGA